LPVSWLDVVATLACFKMLPQRKSGPPYIRAARFVASDRNRQLWEKAVGCIAWINSATPAIDPAKGVKETNSRVVAAREG
jgi:hypothetical protein